MQHSNLILLKKIRLHLKTINKSFYNENQPPMALTQHINLYKSQCFILISHVLQPQKAQKLQAYVSTEAVLTSAGSL